MSGYRPQNRGNRASLRIGPGVTRRLRQAGINVSPAAAKFQREGIFVSAQGLFVSVYIDLGNHERVRGSSQDVARAVSSWGITPTVTEKVHEEDGGLTATVAFTYPTPTPRAHAAPSQAAAPQRADWARVQATTITATLASAGIWTHHGVTVEQLSTTSVKVVVNSASDELLPKVEDALRKKKYEFDHADGSLTVRKAKKVKRG